MISSPYRYYHGPEYLDYDFGPDHVFHPIRQELTLDLVKAAGLIEDSHLATPPPATCEEIALFHESAFIEAVKAVGRGEPEWRHRHRGLGTADNPTFSGMHEAAAVRVGATLQAVQCVIKGNAEHCVNFGGGLHHAMPDRASGFCIYNDIGVAIAWLRKQLNCKVAYVDLDAHHGDGIQWGFYEDPDVLAVSIHESGQYLFPGTGGIDERGSGKGLGASVNIPLLPGTDGESWLECFEIVVPEVLEAFRPDILITQHGCDADRLDPLTHLKVSVVAMEQATGALHRLAHDLCGGRWVALGGGGYAIWQVVPRAWGLVWAHLTDQETADVLPDEWVTAWRDKAPVPLPARWRDATDGPPIDAKADLDREWRRRENRTAAAQSLQGCLSLLRGRSL